MCGVLVMKLWEPIYRGLVLRDEAMGTNICVGLYLMEL